MAAFVPGLPLAAPRASTFFGTAAASSPPPPASASVARRGAGAATMVTAVGTPTKFDRMRQKWGAPAVDESKGDMYVRSACFVNGGEGADGRGLQEWAAGGGWRRGGGRGRGGLDENGGSLMVAAPPMYLQRNVRGWILGYDCDVEICGRYAAGGGGIEE